LKNDRWRLEVSHILNIEYLDYNSKQFTLKALGNLEDLKTKISVFSILPNYLYDPIGLLDQIDLEYILSDYNNLEDDAIVKSYQYFFQSDSVQETLKEASSAYRILQWQTGQSVVLEKVSNWWGFHIENPGANLTNCPDLIKYEVIPDESVALLALQNGTIDVLTDIAPAEFRSIMSNDRYRQKFHFLTPTSYQFYYLAFNSRLEKLSHNLRKAVDYLMPYYEIIEVAALGFGQRTIGPINPVDSIYYNYDLPLVESDVNVAESLLKTAGYSKNQGLWVDGNDQLLKLNLMYPAGSQIYQNIALILKDKFRLFGIELILESVETSLHSKRMRSHDFEISLRALRGGPLAHNFAPIFGTQAANIGGLNFSGFGDNKSDSVINVINNTEQKQIKVDAMRHLQELLYDSKIMLFLFFAKDRIAVSKRFKNVFGFSRSPGYDVTKFQLANPN